ncbi:MAG: hypothetical protein KDD63_26965, partial [Bacteroidetes bacterium]|nr:hypothetical protein [Bacteroidota bacterium]
YLIKVVKRKNPELSALALELVEYADEQLLRQYRSLFLKKSQSWHHAERNRSLYILQRIKDERIEEVMVERWNDFSNREVGSLVRSRSLRIWCELMLYNIKDRELLEKSIISTLREKKLGSDALKEYLSVVQSFVSQEHDIKIEEEVIEILMKTKDMIVADKAAAILSDSRNIEAWDGLIQALDHKNDDIRSIVAKNLISRSDFDIVEQQILVERMLADSSPPMIFMVYTALTWKEPGPEETAVIIKSMINHLGKSDKSTQQKAYLLMNFYSNLNQTLRESLSLSDPIPTSVLKSFELTLHSPL